MPFHVIRCDVCSRLFEAVRSDAEVCSAACKQRRLRARAKERAGREREAIVRATAVLAALRSAAAITPDD